MPFFVAILLNELRHAGDTCGFLVYLPVMLPPASALLLFQWFYDPSYGLFNHILRHLHLPASQWLQSSGTGYRCDDLRGHRGHLDEHGRRAR